MSADKLLAIRRGLHAVVTLITAIGAVSLSLMVLLVFVNAIGRYLFRMPLQGTVEIVELALVVTVFFSMAYTEVVHSHVAMDEVVARFPRRVRAITSSVMYLAAAVFFFIMGWRDGVLAVSYMKPLVRVTDTLHIPIAPFIFAISIGATVFGLELLMNGLCPFPPEEGEKVEGK